MMQVKNLTLSEKGGGGADGKQKHHCAQHEVAQRSPRVEGSRATRSKAEDCKHKGLHFGIKLICTILDPISKMCLHIP